MTALETAAARFQDLKTRPLDTASPMPLADRRTYARLVRIEAEVAEAAELVTCPDARDVVDGWARAIRALGALDASPDIREQYPDRYAAAVATADGIHDDFNGAMVIAARARGAA